MLALITDIIDSGLIFQADLIMLLGLKYNPKNQVLKFSGVRSELLDSIWRKVSPDIQKALDNDHNRTKISTVYNAIKKREMQLWVTWGGAECVFVTKILILDNGKQFKILYCGGSFGDTTQEERLMVFNILKQFAQSKGCTEMEILGRPGWLKICPELKKDYIAMRLEL